MKELTINNIKVRDLPKEWTKQMDFLPEETVTVTIRPEAMEQPKRKVDWEAAEKILNNFDCAPILDSRTPDEIIGYNEYGIPE